MSIFFIISFYLCFITSSNQEIINNPIKSKRQFNPIDYMIICHSQNVQIKQKELIIKEDNHKYLLDSYIISQPLLLCKDESNNNFLLVENNYYKVDKKTNFDIHTESLYKKLDTEIKFLGYFKIVGSSKVQLKNEMVFYGTSNQKLIFYHIREGRKFTEDIGTNNEQISCKFIKDYTYICAVSKSKNIIIYIFVNINDSIINKQVNKNYKLVEQMQQHENPILYDTSSSNYKVLCAKKILDNHINCLGIFILNINQINYENYDIYNNLHLYSLYDTFQTSFSYKEDNCNFTEFNSEYLLCCSKSDRISCDRRKKDFNLITNFYVNLPGKNSNLTFEKSNEFIKLIYSNNKNGINNIYEYFIYPPICNDKQISITSYQTTSIKISDLFKIKTNTKYYISFDNIDINFAELKINDNIIKNKEKILIENKENYLYIISKDNSEKKNYIISYTVSIEETYSTTCQISLTIDTCYQSCKKCSKGKSISNDKEHNCNECNENYYPFEIKKSNCFTKAEITKNHPDSYFDEKKNVFNLCNINCKQCFGGSSDNCLSCFSDNNLKYLYNGQCLSQCPNGNCPSKNNEGNFICEKCDTNNNNNKLDNNDKISTENNKELIFDFISSNSSSSVTSNSEQIQVISTSDKMSIEEQLKTGVSPVDLGNCTNIIKEFYNISKEENLIILNQEKRNNNRQNKSSDNNDNSISLGKYSQIEIYDLSGRKLDLSVCKTGIKILKYLGDVETLNINSAKNYADIGIDIFNASSDYFNNICVKTDDGKDIVVNDRRTDIYQNFSFCQDGCIYKGMNYDLMIANCICDSTSLQGETNFTNNEYNNTETSQFKTLVKSFMANLLDFNIDIIYCYNLVFNIPILKKNIGFYFMILMNALQICSLIIFLFTRLKSIKKYLIKFKSVHNPIKRKSIVKKLEHVNNNVKIDKVNLGQIIIIDSKKLIANKNSDKCLSKEELFNKSGISSRKKLKNINEHKNSIKINNIGSRKKKKFYFNKLNNGDLSSNDKIGKSERNNGSKNKSLSIYNKKIISLFQKINIHITLIIRK